ncbi:MAG TPA: CAP domain-containing protein [Myxococcaceae bacterium]|jgi:uncharacterized protein YkwD
MLALALTALVAAAPLTPESMEQQAAQHVVREFERVGRRAPVLDKALTEAARRLARESLGRQGQTIAPDLHSLTMAVSDSGGADPSPRAFIIRAWTHAQAIEAFLGRKDFNGDPATHFGVGVITAGERATLMLLLAERKATLVHFPRNFPRAPSTQTLCGELATPLRSADVYVTQPDGTVEHLTLSRQTGPRFCAQVRFPKAGGYTVEVIGRGTKGPEVAALFQVDVGGPRERGNEEPTSEPTTVEEARKAIVARINHLRRAYKLKPLTPDPVLEKVAQDYSERMAREGFFAHVAPDGSDVRSRLAALGPSYRSAGENLGLAPGPLSAHFGIEHSPGHRKNLLMQQFTHVGIGVAFKTVDGQPQAIVTEVFSAAGLPPQADPLQATYEAIDAKRKARKLTPLKHSDMLEQIAMSHVRRALKQDLPKTKLSDSNLHDRVFDAMGDVATTAADFYITEDPTDVPESQSLLDPRNTQVGVGVVRGDSPTYGKAKFWVVVIYTTPR